MNPEFIKWLNEQEYRHFKYNKVRDRWFIDGVIKFGRVSILTWEWSEIISLK